MIVADKYILKWKEKKGYLNKEHFKRATRWDQPKWSSIIDTQI